MFGENGTFIIENNGKASEYLYSEIERISVIIGFRFAVYEFIIINHKKGRIVISNLYQDYDFIYGIFPTRNINKKSSFFPVFEAL